MAKTLSYSLTLCAAVLQVCCLLSSSVEADNGDDTSLQVVSTFKNQDCNRKSKVTDVLTLHYKGMLESGAVFDSSFDRNEPFSFQLGIGQVIKGWDQGLVNVCEGDKLKLIIPPKLGYGDSAKHDKIPPNSTLEFEIEIIKIADGPNPTNVFKNIDTDHDGKLSHEEVKEFLSVQLAGNSQYSELNSLLEEIFQNEDHDKDGYITRDEFSGPKYDHDEL